MENKRWADITDSDSEIDVPTPSTTDFANFKYKYSKLRPPITFFIKNISFSCPSDQDISKWFSSQLKDSVFVIRNFKKTVFKGDAKMEVGSLELAFAVVCLAGKEYMGRALEIKVLDSLPYWARQKNRSANSFCYDLRKGSREDGKKSENTGKRPPKCVVEGWRKVERMGVVDVNREENAKRLEEVEMESIKIKAEKGRYVQRRTRSFYMNAFKK
jgi:hypothetical protein